MSFREKLRHEVKSILLTTLYFAICFGTLVLIKRLILADYQIQFRGLSLALIGALIMAKVVLIMEHVPLGTWIEKRPAIVDVIVRTFVYGLGVFVVLILEKSFEARHDFGGFLNALAHIYEHPDYPHIWANTICVFWTLLGFNLFSMLRNQLGKNGLRQLFLSPPKEDPETHRLE
jgi:hypothetical protein